MGVSVDVAKCVRTGSLTLIKDAKHDEVYECYDCGCRLIPKMGTKRRYHFAHLSGEGSHKCCQTAVHIMAKMVFQDMSIFRLPSVTLDESFFNSGIFIDILKSEVVEIKSVILEKSAGDFIPDVTLETNKGTLLVEIYVSHKVDEDKLQKIRKAGINTIEIDLSKEGRDLSYDEIKQLIETGNAKARWVFNKDLERLRKEQESFPVYFTHSSINEVDCPLLKSYTNDLGTLSKCCHCSGCPFYNSNHSDGKDACYLMSYCACVDDLDFPLEKRMEYWNKRFENSISGLALYKENVAAICDDFSASVDLETAKQELRELKSGTSSNSNSNRFWVNLPNLNSGGCYVYANEVGDRLVTKNGKDLRCPKCGASMVLRKSKSGYFGGCSRFASSRCTGTRDLLQR